MATEAQSRPKPKPCKYRFVRNIARGGMGVVDLAVREEGVFCRAYAVKRLREEYRNNADVRAMFVEEARIAGLVHHPNVVSVLDTGEDEQGPFLVMDFVEGISVACAQEAIRSQGDAVPVQVAIQIVIQVARGLHAAHELVSHDGTPLKLVHRDVSPQNIMVGFDGVVRLTDFGIAKAIGRSTRTSTGLLKGKFGYLSPEQLQFEEPDRRTDLFSLGVVFYELLSGHRLYGGQRDPAAAARRILREPPPDIGCERDDIHPALTELLIELLTKDPEFRPSDAQSVERRLETILVELLLEEEPVRLADWVNERFGETRKEQHRELEMLTQMELQAEEEEGGETATVVLPTPNGPRGFLPVRREVVFAGLLMTVLGAVGGAIGATEGSEAPIAHSVAAPPSSVVLTKTQAASRKAAKTRPDQELGAGLVAGQTSKLQPAVRVATSSPRELRPSQESPARAIGRAERKTRREPVRRTRTPRPRVRATHLRSRPRPKPTRRSRKNLLLLTWDD